MMRSTEHVEILRQRLLQAEKALFAAYPRACLGVTHSVFTGSRQRRLGFLKVWHGGICICLCSNDRKPQTITEASLPYLLFAATHFDGLTARVHAYAHTDLDQPPSEVTLRIQDACEKLRVITDRLQQRVDTDSFS